MTNFEVHEKNRRVRVSISKNGILGLTGAAHKDLGKPEYIEYLFDRKRKVFAIRPAQKTRNAYKLKKPMASGYTTAFVRDALDGWGIDYTKTRQYVPWVENNTLMCIDVSEATK